GLSKLRRPWIRASSLHTFPNEETFLTHLIDEDHLGGIFHVVDRDGFGELYGPPVPLFADDANAAVTVYIVGAAHRHIRRRTRSHRRAITALAMIVAYLKAAKRDRFIKFPIIPNAFIGTELSSMLGEV